LAEDQVDDPASFARTAFIQALQQAGVTVTASPTGPNPEALLLPAASYQASDMVGKYVSPPLSQLINLLLKVSYNRGADLMTCLAAVKLGSTNLPARLDCRVGHGHEARDSVEERLSLRRSTLR
jgi:D-alanyl-D-alanine carboxypeptidase/D-alanyl-D-alanine-endopeptidase (penicillin-binding protein 4)